MTKIFDVEEIRGRSGATLKVNNMLLTLEVRQEGDKIDCVWISDTLSLLFYVNPTEDTISYKVVDENDNMTVDTITRVYPEDDTVMNTTQGKKLTETNISSWFKYYLATRSLIKHTLDKFGISNEPIKEKKPIKTLKEIEREAEELKGACALFCGCADQEITAYGAICKTDSRACASYRNMTKAMRKMYIGEERLKRIEAALNLPIE